MKRKEIAPAATSRQAALRRWLLSSGSDSWQRQGGWSEFSVCLERHILNLSRRLSRQQPYESGTKREKGFAGGPTPFLYGKPTAVLSLSLAEFSVSDSDKFTSSSGIKGAELR